MSLIIIEGPDGAGKSTLVEQLSKDFGYRVYRSGGPKTFEMMVQVLDEMEILCNKKEIYICDRSPWFSEIVYATALKRPMAVDEISLLDYWHLPQKVIYCRLADQNKMLARMSLAFKAHKPLEHTNAVIENYKAVCTEYESVMSDAKRAGVNIFKYDWEVTSLQSLKDWI